MVSQRDAELNMQMALESTQIARDTRQDGKSLAALQILGAVFLPVSLCTVHPSPPRVAFHSA